MEDRVINVIFKVSQEYHKEQSANFFTTLLKLIGY